jgi:aldose sugar dehydrogenase
MSFSDVLILARPIRVSCVSVLVFLNLLGIASVVGVIDEAFAAPTIRNSNLEVQVVVTGLNSPTSMAFIGQNDILVLEKNTGMVKRIKDGRVLTPALVDLSVNSQSERGLLGIDVIKTSSIHHYVFLYYTKAISGDGSAPLANQLVRYIFTNNPDLGTAQGRLSSPKLILNLPVTPGPNHDGGKVSIRPGGNVYTVIGDLNKRTKAQNIEDGPNADGAGGILRIAPSGTTVGGIIGNTHPLNKYFAYGIRNSFGLDFDPLTGRLWDTENGPASNDEINLVEPGFNSGWIDIMGVAPPGFNFNNLESFGGKGKYSNPEFIWRQVVAPTAIEFFNSGRLGSQYQNDMFVGDFNKGRIYDFNLNSHRNALALTGALSDRIANTDSEIQSVIFGQGFGGISDLKVGIGDGYLYVLSISNGAVYRILPRAASLPTFSSNEQARIQDAEEPLEINNKDDDSDSSNKGRLCEKLVDRSDQIEEQEDRGGLNEEQAAELRERIEAMEMNMGCQ